MSLFKLLVFLSKGDKGYFDMPVSKQKDYLRQLGDPSDNIDRSYKQYKCQNLLSSKWKVYSFNFLSIIVTPIALFTLFIKGLFTKPARHIDALASMSINSHLFDGELLKEFDSVDDKLWGEGKSLSYKDFRFVFKIIRKGLLSPYFACKSIILVSIYSEMIRRYTPKALLAHCEFSFSCSLLTEYCRQKGVEHINTMHGEKFYYIRDAYVNFDRFYIWDAHYKETLVSIKAEPKQFRIFIPKSLKFDCDKYTNQYCFADYKYYLQIYNEDELKQIISILRELEKNGETFKMRPHPRYSDMKLLHSLLDNEHIENPKEIGIEESISNSNYVIGSFTTVLNQAYYSGRTAVLDDVVYKDQYVKLSDIQYILTKKNVLLLSELKKNEKGNEKSD